LSVGLGEGTDLQLLVTLSPAEAPREFGYLGASMNTATLANQRLVSFLAHDLAEVASDI
jgi:hypothetical protein